MDGRWSDGQIELFNALGKICERVGREGANGVCRQEALSQNIPV